MKHDEYSIIEQIRRNLLAIISLTVAISALGYNTWRNETTEENRNIRLASFEILVQLGKLQIITDHAHYGNKSGADIISTSKPINSILEGMTFNVLIMLP